MPPALILLALVAIGVPAGARALVGRPREVGAAILAAAVAGVAAQVVGELAGSRTGVVGDAQLLLAAGGAILASIAVGVAERRR